MFKRKVYEELLDWKNNYADKYACLLEGARRVGKTTIAEEFARKEYKSYILVDFSNLTDDLLDVFNNIAKLDLFFLRLQTQTQVKLYEGESIIIFDEIQAFPRARQAIKHLVKDGRYHYIETGSLISIKKNVKDILIPSEEHKINVYPMDFEEFMWATDGNYEILKQVCQMNSPIGDSTNRTLMREFRLYMAVGGMPQAVAEYLDKNNFEDVDRVKRDIIGLYKDDLRKIDPSGKLSNIFNSIPSQLALGKKRFVVTAATGKQKTAKDEERIFELIDSKVVLPCFHVTKPNVALAQTQDNDTFKLYISDIGLFTSLIFDNGQGVCGDIYKKLLSDKLDADLGYLYENVAAQMITASGRQLYYHTWAKENSTHYYEIDFLLTSGSKVIPIEIKSSAVRTHKSIDEFCKKYSNYVGRRLLFSQKDFGNNEMLELRPMYSMPIFLKEL